MSYTLLLDGKYANGIYIGRGVIGYPFSANGDTQSITITRQFRALETNYIRGQMGVMHDPVFSDAYLSAETDPVPIGIGSIVGCQRTFARVPTAQVVYSSIALAKPNPSVAGTSRGTLIDKTASYAGSEVGTAYSYGNKLFGNNAVYSRITVSGSITAPTGGTYTITYNGSTTAALAYNALSATIATAMNGLASSIAEGLTWEHLNNTMEGTGNFQLRLTFGSTAVLCTIDGSSLTTTGSKNVFGSLVGSADQYFVKGYRLAAATHGLAASGTLIANTSSADTAQVLLAYTTQWSVVDANTIDVSATYASPTRIGKSVRSYTQGTDRVRAKKTESFYLPGITSGITTADDIPLPESAIDDSSFLTLIAGIATGYQTYDAEPLSLWMGKIYRQAIVAINVDDL